jgi:AGZA family xanthine/uracil permease-like MFS transporter
MCKAAAEINWRYHGDAIPAFLTIAIMPFTYSIAYGLIAGILSYVLINATAWLLEKGSVGRVVPPNKDESDPWSYKVPGGFFPPWLRRAARGKKDFWREDEEESVNMGVVPGGSVSSHDRPEGEKIGVGVGNKSI